MSITRKNYAINSPSDNIHARWFKCHGYDFVLYKQSSVKLAKQTQTQTRQSCIKLYSRSKKSERLYLCLRWNVVRTKKFVYELIFHPKKRYFKRRRHGWKYAVHINQVWVWVCAEIECSTCGSLLFFFFTEQTMCCIIAASVNSLFHSKLCKFWSIEGTWYRDHYEPFFYLSFTLLFFLLVFPCFSS